ncbi:hypothetical protein AB0942_12570 [Streptomyces nodosus]|uniref:hypothetical protein n=1 Tax=Streptomyces nodosus TaxID=40318 RepID=UPI0034565AD3
MSRHDVRGRWIKGEVERRAQLSYEKAQGVHEQLNDLMMRHEAFTPTMLREAVATQYSDHLWSRAGRIGRSPHARRPAALPCRIEVGAR